MRKQALLPLLAALALGSSACTSVSVYQTGKTLPKGDFQAGMGLGGGKVRNKARITGFDQEFPSVMAEMWGRYGITDRVDAGLKLSLVNSMTADARYSLLDERRGAPLSMAAGVSACHTSVQTSHTGYDDKTDISDFGVPVYISKDISEAFTVYTVPRYVRRIIRNEKAATPTLKEKIDADMVGLGGGIMFNLGRDRASHIALEYHKVFEPSDPSHYTQNVGVSLAFDF